jgi:hypothetical protein
MNTWSKVTVVTMAVAVPAFLLGPVLFPPSGDFPTMVGTQLYLMVVVVVVEALALGLAVAFLLFAWPSVRRIVGPSRPRTLAAYLATAWVLGNWWLHDSLHLAVGLDMNGLIAIEYAFHMTLIAAGMILAWQLHRTVEEHRIGSAPGETSSSVAAREPAIHTGDERSPNLGAQ